MNLRNSTIVKLDSAQKPSIVCAVTSGGKRRLEFTLRCPRTKKLCMRPLLRGKGCSFVVFILAPGADHLPQNALGLFEPRIRLGRSGN